MLAEDINDAGAEWCFRADHGQANIILARESRQFSVVGDGQWLSFGHIRIAWRAVDCFHLRALLQFPYQRMFATAAADD
jgi:hypothetical protein